MRCLDKCRPAVRAETDERNAPSRGQGDGPYFDETSRPHPVGGDEDAGAALDLAPELVAGMSAGSAVHARRLGLETSVVGAAVASWSLSG